MGSDYTKYGPVAELRAQSIFARDRFDVSHADALLANMSELGMAWKMDFPGHGREVPPPVFEAQGIPSIGSDFEIAWAIEWDKPVVLIAGPGNPYEQHPFLRGAHNIVRFDTLDEGIDWLINNLGIYTEEV